MMDCQALSIVIFVWMIIAYEAISYAYLFLPLLFNESQTLFWLLTPFFTIFVVFICITYYLSIYTKPGHPSFELNTIYSEQIQQLKKNAKLQQEQKRSRRQRKKQGLSIEITDQINNLTKISFCFKCQVVKQPRVHHCKICRKCILRMDHHCPWVGNCVGKMNHKYFILFLLYATLGLLLVSISIFVDIMTGNYYLNQLDEGLNYILYFTCFSSFALSLSIGFLFITQIMGSKNNLTTLDTFVDQIHERNPWTRGSWKQNFRQIFGDSWWFLPTSPFSSQQISQSLHKTGYSVESL